MAETLWRRLRRRTAQSDDTAAAIRELTAAVRELTAAQRKQAEQLKRLRDSQQASEERWRDAIAGWQQTAIDAGHRDAHAAARDQERLHKRWQGLLQAAQEQDKTERKWRAIFSRQLDAVLRRLALTRLPLTAPFDITAQRFRLRSQNEEDGVILALLEEAGWTDRRFVEIGSGRSGGNAALLAYECGWHGLMIDMAAVAIDKLRERFRHNPGVVAVVAEVTPDNVNSLLTTHGFTGEVDLLSIDIDSYDYFVLEALTVCTPRVLVLEYNAAFGPERAVTIPLAQPLAGAPKIYRGASLAALTQLAERKGYRLVACENAGINAFYLRHDVAVHVPGVDAATAFRPALSRLTTDEDGGEGAAVLDESYPLVEVGR